MTADCRTVPADLLAGLLCFAAALFGRRAPEPPEAHRMRSGVRAAGYSGSADPGTTGEQVRFSANRYLGVIRRRGAGRRAPKHRHGTAGTETSICISQWREIGTLTGWLERAGAPLETPAAAHDHHGAHAGTGRSMAGMASNEELPRLYDTDLGAGAGEGLEGLRPRRASALDTRGCAAHRGAEARS
ncbi:DUF305 domain-containing protein [Nocardia flavorosea]|uniref:DUF305 domain-containing protein n=1 Tax=Nocardia flavorosea TaxID=53429 RepID=UPI002455EF3D|nr:DUF305 domain-containing protein [Nocardia flavorosea]